MLAIKHSNDRFGLKKPITIMLKIVGIGEVLWDMLPDGKRIGGAPANFAYFSTRFGHEGIIVSAVGNDRLGRQLRSELSSTGVVLEVMTSCCFPTGKVDIHIDNNGIPSYHILQHTAFDNIFFTQLLERRAIEADVVAFGTLAQRSAVSRATIRHFLDLTRPDCIRVFDVNLRQNYYSADIIHESLRRCDILKVNDEEATIIQKLTGMPIDEIMNSYGISYTVITCGEKGSRVLFDGGESCLQASKVNVIDTVGAGDAFTAAFASAIAKDRDVESAHKVASKFSALTCTHAGAIPSASGS